MWCCTPWRLKNLCFNEKFLPLAIAHEKLAIDGTVLLSFMDRVTVIQFYRVKFHIFYEELKMTFIFFQKNSKFSSQ